MIRLAIQSGQVTDGLAALDAPQRHYLDNVMRQPVGARIEVLWAGVAWHGEILAGGRLRLLDAVAKVNPIVPRAALAPALLKGDQWSDVTNLGTQAGVVAFQPLVMTRTVVREASSHRLARGGSGVGRTVRAR